jgi:predicted RNA polymerase sigma factor
MSSLPSVSVTLRRLVALLQAHGDDAGLVDVAVVLESRALHDAALAHEGEVVASLLEVLDREVRARSLAGLATR